MSDTVFALKLAIGWACHNIAEFWGIAVYFAALIAVSWHAFGPELRRPDPRPEPAPHDDEVIAAMRRLGAALAAEPLIQTRPAPADNITRHFEALLNGPLADERNNRKEKP